MTLFINIQFLKWIKRLGSDVGWKREKGYVFKILSGKSAEGYPILSISITPLSFLKKTIIVEHCIDCTYRHIVSQIYRLTSRSQFMLSGTGASLHSTSTYVYKLQEKSIQLPRLMCLPTGWCFDENNVIIINQCKWF